jgi:cyanophycinase-like exopeptidase
MKILRLAILINILILLSIQLSNAQTFYRTGNTEDVVTTPVQGIVLAGGAGDNDDAMKWFLQRANGGDIVVLRASGADGYNEYFFSDLGITVNSVTTIVITTAEQADDDTVEQTILNAEALFIAGGDQWNYVSKWKNTKLLDALDFLINDKGITIAGTSAGMAVLGEVVFTAEFGIVWSSEALENPYNYRIKLDKDFLKVPYLENTVTDTHYNRPQSDGIDRKPRHFTFLARMIQDWALDAKGIAANEYTAIAVDENGLARVFGEAEFDDYAYFLQKFGGDPEVCTSVNPLTWNRDGKAVKVYRVKGNEEGSNTFNLSDWETGDGGVWSYWFVDDGEFFEEDAPVGIADLDSSSDGFVIYPNPSKNIINADLNTLSGNVTVRVLSLDGQVIRELTATINEPATISINIEQLKAGVYLLQVSTKETTLTKKWIKL